ncbi:MAG TPA: PEP-CTERM sorting domain-containing protein [Candidatus Limnocylindrales bacterium]|nr:PEP-CTERM sorting domain-containing protein [Candidatus Limnocylindrales bacterium]
MAAVPSFAQFTANIAFDENCNGIFTNSSGFHSALPCALMQDPVAGGLVTVAYDLLNPPGLTAGDVFLLEPGAPGVISDVLRFEPTVVGAGRGTGVLFVYSDNLDGVDALADVGIPSTALTNAIIANEIGPEGNNGVTYTPTAGQPGFVAGAGGPVTYTFTSDSAVPEPATGLLLIAPLMLLARRRRKV